MGMDENGLRGGLRMNDEQEVKSNLGLEAIAKDAGIEVTDEEVDAEYAKMAEENDMELDKVKEYVNAESVKNSLRSSKAMDLIVENAQLITQAEADAEQAAEEAAEKPQE